MKRFRFKGCLRRYNRAAFEKWLDAKQTEYKRAKSHKEQAADSV